MISLAQCLCHGYDQYGHGGRWTDTERKKAFVNPPKDKLDSKKIMQHIERSLEGLRGPKRVSDVTARTCSRTCILFLAGVQKYTNRMEKSYSIPFLWLGLTKDRDMTKCTT